jgi:hypothetical protein
MEGPVKTEALNMARLIVKEALIKRNERISEFKSTDITQAARKLLKQMPELVDLARANWRAQRKRK